MTRLLWMLRVLFPVALTVALVLLVVSFERDNKFGLIANSFNVMLNGAGTWVEWFVFRTPAEDARRG